MRETVAHPAAGRSFDRRRIRYAKTCTAKITAPARRIVSNGLRIVPQPAGIVFARLGASSPGGKPWLANRRESSCALVGTPNEHCSSRFDWGTVLRGPQCAPACRKPNPSASGCAHRFPYVSAGVTNSRFGPWIGAIGFRIRTCQLRMSPLRFSIRAIGSRIGAIMLRRSPFGS